MLYVGEYDFFNILILFYSVIFIIFCKSVLSGGMHMNNTFGNLNYLPDFNMQEREIKKICFNYRFVNCFEIGRSVCNRKILALHVGNKKSKALWIGAHHGLEWITTLVILKFFGEICEKIRLHRKIYGIDVLECLRLRGLTVIPCLNPDGVEISLKGFKSAGKEYMNLKKFIPQTAKIWQSNAHGVDLNHNYNADWEALHELEIKNKILNPSHTRYGGIKPESEPETVAICNLCRRERFEYAMAFHSQGEEVYWNYDGEAPLFAEKFAKVFAISSGYSLSAPEGLAVGGGFKDWFIKKFHRPAFTIEVGKGKNPLPIEDFPKIYKKVEKSLYIGALVRF